jgi:hypothetical protein
MERNKAKILIGKDAKLMHLVYSAFPEFAGQLIAKVLSANHGGIFNAADTLRAPVTDSRPETGSRREEG